MPKYFFRPRDRFNDPVSDGVELLDTAAARSFAIVSVRELICSDVRTGIMDLTGSIDILDESGDRLDTVLYTEAVMQVTAGGGEPGRNLGQSTEVD